MIKKYGLILALIFGIGAPVVQAAPIITVIVSTGPRQPNTTDGFFLQRSTSTEFHTSVIKSTSGLTAITINPNGSVTVGTMTFTNVTGSSLTFNYGTISTFTATNATIQNEVVANSTFTNLTATNQTVTNQTVTNQIVTRSTTTTLTVGLGTAGAPSIQVTGDSDTGIFSTGAGNVSVTANGVRQISVNPGSISANASLAGNQFQFLASSGTAAAPAYSQNVAGGTDTGAYFPDGGTISLSADGAERLRVNSSSASTTVPTYIKGTTTNDDAPTGWVGEYISSVTTTNSSAIATGAFDNISTMTLTAGDWDVSCSVFWQSNSATVTQFRAGISLTSGNSETGMDLGNQQNGIVQTTGITNVTLVVPAVRLSLSGTTDVYLKRMATYTVATPRTAGTRISARRVR